MVLLHHIKLHACNLCDVSDTLPCDSERPNFNGLETHATFVKRQDAVNIHTFFTTI